MESKIETLAVFQGLIVCLGYSQSGPPTLYYDGQALPMLQVPVPRPDLVGHWGEGALHWGFRLCAMPLAETIKHDSISVRFPDGSTYQNGRLALPAPTDQAYQAMVERFRALTARGGHLIEIGSRARSGNVYHHLFSDKVRYTGMDIKAGENVDVVADAHHLSRQVQDRFDFALSISVFEHLLMPWKAAIELSRVLKPNGYAFIQSHSAFPLHERPWDFWRYSSDAWNGLFNAHTGFVVEQTVQTGLAWTLPAYASGGAAQDMDRHPNYLISACLVRKVGDPIVDWDADVSSVYDLAYHHE